MKTPGYRLTQSCIQEKLPHSDYRVACVKSSVNTEKVNNNNNNNNNNKLTYLCRMTISVIKTAINIKKNACNDNYYKLRYTIKPL